MSEIPSEFPAGTRLHFISRTFVSPDGQTSTLGESQLPEGITAQEIQNVVCSQVTALTTLLLDRLVASGVDRTIGLMHVADVVEKCLIDAFMPDNNPNIVASAVTIKAANPQQEASPNVAADGLSSPPPI